MPYSSSLTDKEWLIIEPLLPEKKKTRPPIWSKRQILDGIFYQLKNGCNWADLPKDLPPYSTVYWHYKQWRKEGVIEQISEKLHSKLREKVKKNLWTTLIIADSQAVKNTCNASIESKGFCFYKATNGIKRHLGVDSLGFPFFVHCTKANVSDDQGLIEMLTIINYFQTKPVELPKTTILLDQGKSGFIPVKARWVIERSNSWMERCKSLIKNFERTLANATTKINLCFVRLMLKRLAAIA